jgi:aspartyl-tRNA(Asn)/glutamyl-tRNA(Gln) amidotransferase subunit A
MRGKFLPARQHGIIAEINPSIMHREPHMETVATLSADLSAGRTTSRRLLEQALARIADPAGEGARTFLKVYGELARAEADHADRLRKAGIVRSLVDGLPISVKDLFDVGGDITRAGSKIFNDAPPAKADAPVVARLRAAGAIIIGRTNMVEFAFGGLGLNPHYGTPKNPWDRQTGRAPGGSSSGAAVAVADGMGVMGLGSDTRGSVRMPASLCGVVGFKPTQRRIPRDGAFPLSYTLDSIGPLAKSVDCCAAYDAVLAGEPITPLAPLSAKGLRLMVPKSEAIEDLEPHVARSFEAALSALSRAGANVIEVALPSFSRQAEYYKNGGYSGLDAAVIHKPWTHRLAEYDPRVGSRINAGKAITGIDAVEMNQLRNAFMQDVARAIAPFDAIITPTAPCVAPPIAEAGATDEVYAKWNMRIVRNCGLINFLDGCATTIPCQEPGTGPVGFMVSGIAMQDRHILAVSKAVETVINASK